MQSKECNTCRNIFFKPFTLSQNTWDTTRRFCSNKCRSIAIPIPKRKSPPLKGIMHPGWKGEQVGYFALHSWVERELGKAKMGICDFCGRTDSLQWSNKSGHYQRVLTDWQILCGSCHRKYDIKMNGTIPWNKGKKGLQVAWNRGKPKTWKSPGDFKKGHIPWNKVIVVEK